MVAASPKGKKKLFPQLPKVQKLTFLFESQNYDQNLCHRIITI